MDAGRGEGPTPPDSLSSAMFCLSGRAEGKCAGGGGATCCTLDERKKLGCASSEGWVRSSVEPCSVRLTPKLCITSPALLLAFLYLINLTATLEGRAHQRVLVAVNARHVPAGQSEIVVVHGFCPVQGIVVHCVC